MKQLIILFVGLLLFMSCSEDEQRVCVKDYPLDNNKYYESPDKKGSIRFRENTFIYNHDGGVFACDYTYKHPIITLHYFNHEKDSMVESQIIVGENTLTLKDKDENTVVFIARERISQN